MRTAPRRERVHVEPVFDQAAEQPDRSLAGRAALGERQLREDDERFHRQRSQPGPRAGCACQRMAKSLNIVCAT